MNWYIEEYCREAGFECHFEVTNVIPKLSYQAAINTYRIFQEAIHNIRKHADATNVTVQLTAEDKRLILSITDNGCGFDPKKYSQKPAQKHFGIMNMTERAIMLGGKLEIDSEAGRGTVVHCSVPITQEKFYGKGKNINC